MRRSGLFNPKPPVPTVNRASAKPAAAAEARGHLKDAASKAAKSSKVQPIQKAARVPLRGEDAKLRLKSKLTITPAPEKQEGVIQKSKSPLAIVVPEAEDDYADDEFERYDDDFETYEESPKVCTNIWQGGGPGLPHSDNGKQCGAQEEVAEIVQGNEGTHNLLYSKVEDVYASKEEAKAEAKPRPKPSLDHLKQISFKIFSQGPMSLHDLFASGCGPAARLAVAITQTYDDVCTRDTQTTKVAQVDVAAQVPNDGPHCSPVAAVSHPSVTHSSTQELVSWAWERAEETQLRQLLVNAAQVIGGVTSLQAKVEATCLSELVCGRDGQAVCAGHVDLFWKERLMGRTVLDVSHKAGTSLVLCAYSCSLHPGVVNALQGCVCVWDVLKPAQPRHVLVLEGTANCVAWAQQLGSDQQRLVVCGSDAGSVCLWQLQASSSDAESWHNDRPCWPTYSSNHQVEDNHQAPICSIATRSASSQILTVDTLGNVHLWVTVEVGPEEQYRNHGLRPGGCICLMKTAQISAFGGLERKGGGLQMQGATHLSLFPNCAHHLLITTDRGLCFRVALFGNPESPRKYSRDLGVAASAPAICSSFSPFLDDYFLVAYGDGSVALFSANQSSPLQCWESACPRDDKIVGLQWSPAVPSVFFVLRASKALDRWDLLNSSIASQTLINQSVEASAFGVSGNYFPELHCSSTVQGVSHRPTEHFLAVGDADGKVQLHLLLADASIQEIEASKQRICQLINQGERV